MNQNIINPKSIAIVGVSEDKKKIGSVMLENLIHDGYKGEVYPVNPKYEELRGLKCYPSIKDIPEAPEMVCIAIPALAVEAVVDECIEKKVKSIVIIAAGFKETGEAGKKLEESIRTKTKEAGIRVLGPNCLGFINNKENVNLSFVRKNPGNGDIAFISQSGAFCTAILDMALETSLGFSQIYSLGNKADINENELLDLLIKDKDVETIVLYLEEFFDGKEFINIARNTKKPIITIVPGGSEKAEKAVSSHTGSLVSSYDTTIATLKKANNIKVDSARELFDTVKVADLYRNRKIGKRIGILTNAGGPGIIATSFAEKRGLEIPDLDENTKRLLKEILPNASSFQNPLDILGDALAEDYEKSLEILLKDPSIDTVLVLLTPQLVTEISLTAEKISKVASENNKAVFTCFLGGEDVRGGIGILEEIQIVNFTSIKEAVTTIFKIADFREKTAREKIPQIKDLQKKRTNSKLIEKYITNEPTVLPDKVAYELLKEFNVPFAECISTAGLEEAIDFASTRFPVVVKADSSDLAHKTDFKGLYLDIRNIAEMEEKFTALRDNITKITGNASPNILVQRMLEADAEIFLGANREGDVDVYEENGLGFGHLLAFGHGGVYTEIYKDIRNILIPECRTRIEEVMKETKIWKIIEGYRGKGPLAKDKLIDLIENVQRLLITYPEIVSMDMNPIMLNKDNAVVVDTKIYVKN
jgi:acetyl coenzyme A synthetase (ADP forming)-like protein